MIRRPNQSDSQFHPRSSSIHYLETAIQKHFDKNARGPYQFLSGNGDWIWKHRRGHLVLAGTGPSHLMNPWLWPRGFEVRLWALSRAHQRVMAHLLKLRTDQIGCLPLREKVKPRHRILSMKELKAIMVASRGSPSKNWRASLNLALALKAKHKNIQSIHFCSNARSSFSKEDQSWIRKFRDQGVQVDLAADRDWWKRCAGIKTGYIHLSLDFTEDFGVSVTQAIEAGFLPILSAWGAHFDCSNAGGFFVSPADVGSLRKKRWIPPLKKISGLTDRYHRRPALLQTDDIREIASSYSLRERKLIQTLYEWRSDRLPSRDGGASIEKEIERLMSSPERL